MAVGGGHLGEGEPDRQKEQGGGRVIWVKRKGTSQTEGNGHRGEGLSGGWRGRQIEMRRARVRQRREGDREM